MAMERVTVRMIRAEPSTQWGFRMQGGQEYGGPLLIEKVHQGGLADRAGLLEGDRILQIGGASTQSLRHQAAEEAIIRGGNNLDIVVERPATRIWRPEITPVDVSAGDMTTAPLKYSLAHDNAPQNYSTVGSAHNVHPRPFGQQYSSTTTTKSMERFSSPQPSQPSRKTAVDEYLQKTGGLFGTDPKLTQKPPEPTYLKSETLRLIKESESRSSSMGPVDKPSPATQKGEEPQPTVGAPVCDHCGRFIHGVYCKVGNKTLHGDCFKCSTCGSLLKNIGHFLINDKLYCDVHARQQRQQNAGHYSNISRQPQSQASTDPNQNSNYSKSYQYQKTTKTTTTSTTGHQPYSIVIKPAYSDQQRFGTPPPPPAAPTASTRGSTAPPPSGAAPPPYQPTNQIPLSAPSCNSTNYEVISEKRWTSDSTAPPSGKAPARRGRGMLRQIHEAPGVPVCESCNREIRGPFVLALGKAWCPDHFVCSSGQCRRKLLDIGFIEENGAIHCEFCYEKYFAPTCSKCFRPIVGDCLTALERQWHPDCFTCSHCRRPFGSTSFFVEAGQPYCENDWNQLFTTKCVACRFAIEAGDRWVEALGNAYHADCFNCSVCQKNLEGQSFYAKAGRPYCKNHA